jgi:hypothetical protein
MAFSSVTIFTTIDAYQEESKDVSSGNSNTIQWLETNYSSTSTAVLQVVYPSMHFDPKAVDNFDVDVWSDTDFAGIDLTVTETGDATGIFEGTVFFTITDDTSGHRLRVSHGDTFYSNFNGNTLDESFVIDKNDLISTASLHGVGIPIDDRVSLDKKSYAWNDKVIITINAPEENFDVNSIEIIDSSNDLIKIYTRHFGIDNYNLVETGINSGIFSGEILLVDEFDNIDSDGITVSFEYEEDITAIGSAPIVLNSESQDITDKSCGAGTVSIDGVCQLVSVDTTAVDDAPFFGIFVYLDNVISWIFGNHPQSETIDESELNEAIMIETPKFEKNLNNSETREISDIDKKLDEIEKKAAGNFYKPSPREWITSGPFQIDRSEYLMGEKIFIKIGGLGIDEKGQVAFLKQSNETHYTVYQTIPFDGTKKMHLTIIQILN